MNGIFTYLILLIYHRNQPFMWGKYTIYAWIRPWDRMMLQRVVVKNSLPQLGMTASFDMCNYLENHIAIFFWSKRIFLVFLSITVFFQHTGTLFFQQHVEKYGFIMG